MRNHTNINKQEKEHMKYIKFYPYSNARSGGGVLASVVGDGNFYEEKAIKSVRNRTELNASIDELREKGFMLLVREY